VDEGGKGLGSRRGENQGMGRGADGKACGFIRQEYRGTREKGPAGSRIIMLAGFSPEDDRIYKALTTGKRGKNIMHGGGRNGIMKT